MNPSPKEKQRDVIFCARYAFKPNQLSYCGPDKNKELFEYLKESAEDDGLCEIIKKFETLYPYLKLIADSNKISDPFSKKVAEAYWIGNKLLDNVKMPRLYEHLIYGLGLRKKLLTKEITIIRDKIPAGANAHHSFHVFNIWKRTGHIKNSHTLKTMDECRIGWGQVQNAGKDGIHVIYEPIIFEDGHLAFGEQIIKKITVDIALKNPKKSDWIAFHWSSYCGILTPAQLKNIIKWTTINLNLANISSPL